MELSSIRKPTNENSFSEIFFKIASFPMKLCFELSINLSRLKSEGDVPFVNSFP